MLHIKPKTIISNAIDVTLSPQLYSEIKCSICLDVLKQTMVTKECLHRFCYHCITDALRKGNKECPLCRERLPSKRSMHRDLNFDFLISKVYPIEGDGYEAPKCSIKHREGTCRDDNNLNVSDSFGASLLNPPLPAAACPSDRNIGRQLVTSGDPDEIKLLFIPLPPQANEMASHNVHMAKDNSVRVRYLKTTVNASGLYFALVLEFKKKYRAVKRNSIV